MGQLLGMSEREESDSPSFLAVEPGGETGPSQLQRAQGSLALGVPPASEEAASLQDYSFALPLPEMCTWALSTVRLVIQVLSGDDVPLSLT